jgi:hypothetical protein
MKAGKPRVSASIVAAFVVLGALASITLITAGTAAASSPCSTTVHSENAQDNAIQTAINAHPGGTICVAAGTFPEQLTISNSNTILKGAGASSTIIDPNSGAGSGALTFNTVDWDSAPYAGGVTCGSSTCVPLAAIILVESSTPPQSATPTTGVTIEDLTVNGAGGSPNVACGDDYVGVDFQDASGTLTSASVTNVASPPASFGCQEVSGAIYAYNGFYYSGMAPSSSLTVTIAHTTVTGYQKNGITCDDPSENCTITSDTITGAGPITTNGQNGIQVAYGAYAAVEHTSVSGNSYTGPSTSNDYYAYGYAATGILLFDPASGTTVSYDTVTLNQIGILYADDGVVADGYGGPESVTIFHNSVHQSNAYGIVAEGAPGGGDSVSISSNNVNNEQSLNPSIWGAPGILVDTGTFTLTANHIYGSSVQAGSSNGPNQTVCAPSGYPITCSSTENITTAAIQAASESSANPTTVYLNGDAYTKDSYQVATLEADGGIVNA